MALGPALGALGAAFTGMGRDRDFRLERDRLRAETERTRALDAQTAQLHGAQMENYRSQVAQRTAERDKLRWFESPEGEETYYRARLGDKNAQAKVTTMAAGLTNASAILAPFTQQPRRDYLGEQKAMWDYRRENPMPETPAGRRAARAADLASQREARLERTNAENQVAGAKRFERSMLSARPKERQFISPETFQLDSADYTDAMANWRADSTATVNDRKDAEANLAALLQQQSGGAPPSAASRMRINQAQYDKAISMGKSDAEIAASYDIAPEVRRKR